MKPDGVVLLELELWPLFLRNAAMRRIPIAVVNGRISARTARRYSLLREVAARRIGGIAFFGMQTKNTPIGSSPSARLRERGGPRQREVRRPPRAGGLRDAALATLLGLDGRAPVLVGGSTHDPEEAILAAAVARVRALGRTDLRLILVPRHVDRADAITRAVAPILGTPVRLERFARRERW